MRGKGYWKELNNKRFTAPCSRTNFSSISALAIVRAAVVQRKFLKHLVSPIEEERGRVVLT
jgi:hypothetical protein